MRLLLNSRRALFLVAVTFALAPTSRVQAQTFSTLVNVTCRPVAGPPDCGRAEPCGGSTHEVALGSYEFRVFSPEGASEIWFGLDWPEEWTLGESSVCRGTLVSGSLEDPQAGFHFRDLNCDSTSVPILTFVLNCSVPGTLSLGGHPAHDGPEGVRCGGNQVEPTYGRRVTIGDFCGRLHTYACGYCGPDLAGFFSPQGLTFQVEANHTLADTIVAYAPLECTDMPECSTLPRGCYGGVASNVPWMTLQALDDTDWEHHIGVHIDATNLPTGEHRGRISLGQDSAEGCCLRTCAEVSVHVTPPQPTETTTWGRIKVRYRR